MTEPERDPEAVAFERAVRHDATVNHAQTLFRMRRLRGSTRTWWDVRTLLRERRQERK